jgi:hypothetical protein
MTAPDGVSGADGEILLVPCASDRSISPVVTVAPLIMTLPSENELLLGESSSGESSGEEHSLTLFVKSFRDVEITVSDTASVSDLKQVVRRALGPSTENRYLRLICKGRLLAPDTATVKEFGVKQGDSLHAVLAAAGVRGGQQAALARGTTRRYRGTGVGPMGRIVRPSDEDVDFSDEEADEEEGRERLGFDRLRASGLSRQEITAIRSYFSRQVDAYIEENPTSAEEETDLMRRRLLQEDAWMQSQGPTSEFRLNLNQNNPLMRFNAELFPSRVGSDRDFLWGFLLGFFVGLLMLVWVWMPTVPHKQKLGILTGISLHLALSLLRNQEELDPDGGV